MEELNSQDDYDFEDIFKSFKLNSFLNLTIFNNFNSFTKKTFLCLKNFILKKRIESIYFIVPMLDFIISHISTLLPFIILLSFFYSYLILFIFHYIILIDSFILSFIILQDGSIKKNSRRLSKNVISLFFSNNSSSLINLLITFFLYFEISKPISMFVRKIIKIVTILITRMPFISFLYPDCNRLIIDDEHSSE